MKKSKILKGLLSVVFIMVTGALAVIEIGIEMMYQLMKLIKHGYRYICDQYLKTIEPVYDDKLKWKHGKFDSDDIKIIEYDLDEELEGEANN